MWDSLLFSFVFVLGFFWTNPIVALHYNNTTVMLSANTFFSVRCLDRLKLTLFIVVQCVNPEIVFDNGLPLQFNLNSVVGLMPAGQTVVLNCCKGQ